MMENRCIRIRIAKEEDREKIAGILAKNGYGVKQTKDYRTTKDGAKSKNNYEHFLTVEGVEDSEWN